MSPERLSSRTLSTLPADVAKPAYERALIRPGIVHLGVGAFHRAHQAVYVDDCLAAGETDWGIVGASLRSADTRDALGPQDGLYTLAVRDGEGERLRVVGSILSLLVAPENPEALLAVLTDPGVRIVTLTITEKAYLRAAGGGLDMTHPDIVHDLANPGAPRTAHGFLAEALARRRKAGIPSLTVLSCDNLPANGETLHALLSEFASLRDAGLARHIAEDVAFPSSMIDRIVPATIETDRARLSSLLGVEDAWPVVTEPFCQWVVEDRFPQGRPAWERFGVTMVADVRAYEDMKLRLLNGSHSAIAYLGLLSGHETVDRAFADPHIRAFVDGLWAEAIATLPAGLDTEGYTRRLARRYANPALAHRTAQIANDGSQKLPQRILGSALDRLEAGASPDHLMLAVAAWITACEMRGGTLRGQFTDPLDEPLSALAGRHLPATEMARAVFDLAGFARDRAGRDRLIELTAAHLDRLRRDGPTAVLAVLAEKGRVA
ncbi:mannitol dehydrogenase family protein [Mesorhizobium sp. BE184]|uniref:mannitol dehydrogenase family protein n=1 Tax=Mesorhizobium sp. BE184 TaxID=2817714 RepID=UPI00285518DB|nr:mannitol dehydrogenase family protein [Mesorhizobium sp. BE184]MDR7034272.1 fructuronate reductase [Mesorhizobium sp. BE184]